MPYKPKLPTNEANCPHWHVKRYNVQTECKGNHLDFRFIKQKHDVRHLSYLGPFQKYLSVQINSLLLLLLLLQLLSQKWRRLHPVS